MLLAAVPARAHGDAPHSTDLDAMILEAAQRHGIPVHLVRRVVERESKYNPRARNHRYWGLMQISYPTARSMGFKGTPEELLNPVTNLTYAVPYLANAFIAAGKREDAAVRLYASGYYDAARRRGILGALRTADSAPMPGFHEEVAAAAPASEPGFGIFGALFGPSDATSPAAPPQTVAAAAPAQAEAAPPAPAPAPAGRIAAAQPSPAPRGGKGSDGDVEMVADKAGRLGPPAKWRRDGGFTVIARGEQVVARVAAAADDRADGARRHGAHHHSRKVTAFASLDLPPAAQAYAADASQAPAPPQAAIEQAVAPGVAGAEAQPAASSAERTANAPAASDPVEGGRSSHRRQAGRHASSRRKAVAGSEKGATKTVADLK